MKNGNKLKFILCLLVSVAAAAVLSGCSTYDSFVHTFISDKVDDANNTIYIGVFEPKTGKYSDKGMAEIKGIELANSIYSSVNGYDVKLIEVDTQSSTSTARTAIEGLIKMNPVAIIGSEGEATSLIASEYIEKACIPTITPTATNPLITQNSKYYFRSCITESQRGSGVAEYAYKNLGSNHIAIIKKKNDTKTTALMSGFNDSIKEYAGKKSKAVVIEEETAFTSSELKGIAEEIRKEKVDVVYVPVDGSETMDTFFRKMEKEGLTDITYIGTVSWGNDDFVKMLKKHSSIKAVFPYETVFSRSGDTSDSITKEAQRFQIQYANKYGSKDIPTYYSALGYDSYMLLINAIHNSPSLKGPDVRQAILDLSDTKCSTGVFKFDESGNTVRSVNISTVRGDKIVSVYVTKHETEAINIEGVEEEE